jgi:hypothetical protein
MYYYCQIGLFGAITYDVLVIDLGDGLEHALLVISLT